MFDDTPATLRRRARSLDEDGYNPQFCSVLLRAADELIVRRRCATEAEQEAVNQLGYITIMKRVLTNIAGIVARSSMSKDDRKAVAQNLNLAAQVRPPHKPRTILSIEIIDNQPFDVFLDRCKELYDVHTGGATHGEEDHEDEEPSGPGRDPDQHPGAEAHHHEARGTAGQPGAGDHQPADDRQAVHRDTAAG